ncbi:MAG TPA: fused MFS/spermidine synthase [Rhizomicrobium sp.]|jgi:spermidine synthase|nr:fused MFS/spermidine synthase [Rhizomicrobium sp.]
MTSLDISASASPTQRSVGAVATFAATVFLSAALLFCIEPMFSKMVLPQLGGSSAVWSIAMVVFQGLMLGGYLYAHLLTRFFKPGVAALIHVTLMGLGTLSLPIAISAAFQTPPEHGVSLWVIGLFLVSIGLPCFGLSANAPLLQAWYAATRFEGASNPYFLYRASNAGSFLVLLAYPFLIEPAFGLSQQSQGWSFGYVVLMAGIAVSGAHALLNPGVASVAAHEVEARSTKTHPLRWVALGFVPSGLLVAVTAHIATDVASAPFLWIVPLALYLLTFVIAFSDKPILPLKVLLAVQPITVAALIVLFLWAGKVSWAIALPCHLIAFFVATMICHTQLYRMRPAASDLTAFYAWMSLGGMLGGMFAALAAPMMFSTVLEYPLLVLAALFVRPEVFATLRRDGWRDALFVVPVLAAFALPFAFLAHDAKVPYFAIAVMALAGFVAIQGSKPARLILLATPLLLLTNLFDPTQSIVDRARSFYGAYKVVDVANGRFRIFFHGTTAHGAEMLRDAKGHAVSGKPEPLSYYYRGGAYSEAMDAVRAFDHGHLTHVALVGLGVGTLSCFAQPGETWTLYELDPMVVQIAQDRSLFRSMATCATNAPVVLGDGRLTLHNARPGLDLLILDVFSSDSVPTHLLTREAFALYREKLGPHGVIAFNISNKNMQLADVVAAAAAANGMVTAVKTGTRQVDTEHTMHLRAQIAVVARSEADLTALHLDPGWRQVQPGTRVWTDDYSNVLGAILRNFGH